MLRKVFAGTQRHLLTSQTPPAAYSTSPSHLLLAATKTVISPYKNMSWPTDRACSRHEEQWGDLDRFRLALGDILFIIRSSVGPYHGSDGQLPDCLRGGQSQSQERLYGICKVTGVGLSACFPLAMSFHQCSALIHSTITYAIQS